MSDEPPNRTVTCDTTVLAEGWHESLPQAEDLVERAARATLAALPSAPALANQRHDGTPCDVEVSLVLADDAAARVLNRDYRGQDKPTNVLSFSVFEGGTMRGEPLVLGDVVLALETVLREAREQEKPASHHLCHLTVHGVLHLLGYDHLSEGEAAEMEALEVRILAELGIGNPYAEIAPMGGAA